MKNTELLVRTLDAIIAGDVEWNQTTWCHCFAGNAVRLHGASPYMRYMQDEEDGSYWIVNVRDEDGNEVNVATYAEKILGLTDEEAADLFASGNDLEYLKLLVSRLVQDSLVEDAHTPEKVSA